MTLLLRRSCHWDALHESVAADNAVEEQLTDPAAAQELPHRDLGREEAVEREFAVLKLHDLRDTFGTYQMMNPENAPREVQEWLGHANLTTTSERYSQYRQLADAPKRAAASFQPRLRAVESDEQPAAPVEDVAAAA